MEVITPRCNQDTFKYSILLSPHYYDINCHPERTTKLKPLENKYDFTCTTYSTFEKNNPDISLTVIDKNNNTIHKSINNADKKVTILKSNDNIYAALKPLEALHVKFDKFFKKYTHKELSHCHD